MLWTMDKPDTVKRGYWAERRIRIKKQMHDLKWNVLALYLARNDPRVPLKSKIAIAVAVGYLLCPIDLIPDFIPVLGQVDDLIIVPALIGYAVKSIPPEMLEEYKRKARSEFKKGSPKAYKAAAVIVLIWVAVLASIVYMIWKAFLS
jgi:uncharacterized membrane protein YkvA (DUF1232 family)